MNGRKFRHVENTKNSQFKLTLRLNINKHGVHTQRIRVSIFKIKILNKQNMDEEGDGYGRQKKSILFDGTI